MHTDPLTGARYPDSTDSPNVSQYIQFAVNDLSANACPAFASTAARDTAFSNWTSGGHTLRDGLICTVGGILHIYHSSAWRPRLSNGPVTTTTNTVTRSDGVADSWAVDVIADPGYPYRIRAMAYVRAFATSCAMNSILHVGSTSAGAGSEPIVSITSVIQNNLGLDLVHLPILSGVITGSGRITGMAQRDAIYSSGSWAISPAPTLIYEIVPEP